MPTICLHCALEAFVASEGLSRFDDKSGVFPEEPWEHVKQAHPNGIDIQQRKELEAKATIIALRMQYLADNPTMN